jgi:hypothetical protein|tara:strand:+ start:210 stop:506 length:297 start_codon:yes stop_codon:yes gene_type:complete
MTIIRDPLLEPYFIGKDAYCYTAYEVITPQKKYLEKGSLGKDYEKPIGHYSDFGNALKAIMKHQLNEKNKEYPSVQEYLDKWNKIKSNLNNLIKKITI